MSTTSEMFTAPSALTSYVHALAPPRPSTTAFTLSTMSMTFWAPSLFTSALAGTSQPSGSCATKLIAATGAGSSPNCRPKKLMGSFGTVGWLAACSVVPLSVPASTGGQSICTALFHRPVWWSHRSRPDTPAIQSGLGAIIDTALARGKPQLAVTSIVVEPTPPWKMLLPVSNSLTVPPATASPSSFLIASVEPVSATLFTPCVAMPPASHIT
mmetsp:Transcript_6443/g.23933  ORF Transcript_6443/g.23933 Transcript_6443/m.23933 type:complete len:213 (+) Transcript_6443:373-1011(+)